MIPQRLIVAITGATGAIYGVRLLEMLRDAAVETHLVISPWGRRTLLHETTYTVDQVQRLATVTYVPSDQGAAISSGSFLTMGMAIVPCSMRTLASVAHGLGDNLIHRAADVVLKERRKLLLAPREAPLSDIHLENMLKLSRMGVVICPPMPGFYQRPDTIDDIVTHSVVRMLDQFGTARRWPGPVGRGVRARRDGKDPARRLRELLMSPRAARGGASPQLTIDLNADIGESFGIYNAGNDDRLLRTHHVRKHRLRISCGRSRCDATHRAHGGERGVAIGAHPGFPDLAGFGRREMSIDPRESPIWSCIRLARSARSRKPKAPRFGT